MHELGHTLDILEMMIDRLSRELYSNGSMMGAVNSAYESMSQTEKNNYSIKRKQLNNLINYRNSLIETISYNEKTTEGTLPLSFTAKNANLISLVRYGKCVQTNLPLGYTQLEYIQSTGTQYINTGITESTNAIIDMQGTPRTDDTVVFMLAPVNATAYQNGFGQYQSTMTGSFDITTRMIYNVSYTSSSLTVNGVDVSTRYIENNVNLALFGSTATNRRIRDAKLYSAKIYNNDTLLRNFIPAKNASDVIGVYDMVSGQFFTNAGTGDFIAGPNVPTPDTPIDIVCNNGVLKAIRNLIDLSAFTNGYYYDPQGVYTSSSNSRLTDYIPIKAGQSATIYFKSLSSISSLNVRINLFNSSKVWQSQEVLQLSPLAEGTMIVTPTYNGYIRVSGNYSGTAIVDWNTTKIVYGEYTVDTIDSAIGQVYTDGTVETINAHGKNLFDKNSYTEINAYVNSNTGALTQGSLGESTQYCAVIPCLPNTTYTISGRANSVWGAFTSSNIGTTATSYSKTENGSITTGANDKYLIGLVRANQGVIDYRNTLQLELGSTATDYEPYYDGGTATAEMLLKVGDYQDVQNIINGVVTRNVGVKVLTGAADEQWGSNVSTKFYWDTNFAIPLNNSPILCTSYQQVLTDRTAGVGNNQIALFLNLKKGRIVICDPRFTTTGQFKQFLADQYAAGTPVIVLYPLATPVTESVAGQYLETKDGVNTVSSTSSLESVTAKITYYE